MRIRLFTALREITGTREVEIDLPRPARIRDALEYLAEKYPAIIPLLFEDNGRDAVKSYYLLVVNGRTPANDGDEEVMDFHLEKDDVLAILPPVGGG